MLTISPLKSDSPTPTPGTVSNNQDRATYSYPKLLNEGFQKWHKALRRGGGVGWAEFLLSKYGLKHWELSENHF